MPIVPINMCNDVTSSIDALAACLDTHSALLLALGNRDTPQACVQLISFSVTSSFKLTLRMHFEQAWSSLSLRGEETLLANQFDEKTARKEVSR